MGTMERLLRSPHIASMARQPYRKAKESHPGHFIREWREHRHLTQESVAARVEMSVPQISKLERGLQGYRQSTLEQFAQALGCEPGDLLRPPPTEARGELASFVVSLDEARTLKALQILRAALSEAA